MHRTNEGPTLRTDGAGFLRGVLDSLPTEVCVIDRKGTIIAVNDQWLTFGNDNGGDQKSFAVGADYLGGICTEIDNDDQDIAMDALEGVRSVLTGQRRLYQLEYPCHGPDEQRWFILTVAPLNIDDEPAASVAPGGAVITHTNITHRVHTERELQRLMDEVQRQESRLDSLLSDVSASVWEAVVSPQGFDVTWVYGSAYTQSLTGWPASYWYGRRNFFYDRIIPEHRDRVRREMRSLLERRTTDTLSFTWVDRFGKHIDVESVTNVVYEAGIPRRIRCVSTDVTRRQQVQKTLRRRAEMLVRTTQALRRSNSELDQFAYVASHDLRAPLRGIRQLAAFVEEDMADDIDEGVKEKLGLMQGRVERMERLIDGLLKYSRIGRVINHSQVIDLPSLVDGVLELLDPPPGAKVHTELGCKEIHADRLRLQQVLQNLIANAIQHHDKLPEGPANVWVRCVEAGDGWHFSVRDDGPGIDPKYHKKVFEMFQKLDVQRRTPSTGIGLSLVKKIMLHLNTDIKIQSSDAGTTFSFTWPKQGRIEPAVPNERELPEIE